jgi:hypothetical protein
LDDGAASGGSQLQTQIYVNRHADELDAKIRGAFAELAQATLSWRSPLRSQRYREYWDRAFLDAVDQGAQWPALKRFWPARGPHWDALAVVSRPGAASGVLLVEAKSHVDELLTGSAIVRQPRRALQRTQPRRRPRRCRAQLGPNATRGLHRQRPTAKRRLKQFAHQRAGEPVGNWGRRYIWPLADARTLLVASHVIMWGEHARDYGNSAGPLRPPARRPQSVRQLSG